MKHIEPLKLNCMAYRFDTVSLHVEPIDKSFWVKMQCSDPHETTVVKLDKEDAVKMQAWLTEYLKEVN